jgi:hypothetical protein
VWNKIGAWKAIRDDSEQPHKENQIFILSTILGWFYESHFVQKRCPWKLKTGSKLKLFNKRCGIGKRNVVVVDTKVEPFVPKTDPNTMESNKVVLIHQKNQFCSWLLRRSRDNWKWKVWILTTKRKRVSDATLFHKNMEWVMTVEDGGIECLKM